MSDPIYAEKRQAHFFRAPAAKMIDRRLRIVVRQLGALAQDVHDENAWPMALELAELAADVTRLRLKVRP